MTLNMVRLCRINPRMSAYTSLEGEFNYHQQAAYTVLDIYYDDKLEDLVEEEYSSDYVLLHKFFPQEYKSLLFEHE